MPKTFQKVEINPKQAYWLMKLDKSTPILFIIGLGVKTKKKL